MRHAVSKDQAPFTDSGCAAWKAGRARQASAMRRTRERPAMSAPQRSALLLHFLEDFPLEEIARITGVSVGTVKSRLHYGKKALREILMERDRA